MSVRLFDHCFSNPPYQLDVVSQGRSNKIRNTVDIFPDFQKLGSSLSKVSAMIYPSSWQKTVRDGLGADLLLSGLFLVEDFVSDDVFPTIHTLYPLSVVVTKKGFAGDILVNNGFRSRCMDVWIKSDNIAKLVEVTKNLPKLPGVRLISDVSNAADAAAQLGVVFHEGPEGVVDPVKMYVKLRPGKQPDGRDLFLTRHDAVGLMKEPEILGKWKVATRSRGVGRFSVFHCSVMMQKQSLDATVFGPDYFFSKTWMLLKVFETGPEAQNFAKYMNTRFALVLTSLDITPKGFATMVPDLEDYHDDNRYGFDFGADLFPQLVDFFELGKDFQL